jgi:copper chaperone CopZ
MKLNVPDMSCEHCKMRINASLKALKGVKTININIAEKTVEITGEFDKSDAISAIEKAGYPVKVAE